ncbi:aminoglycoside phosphotransferase family protein [Paraglaciecola sp. 2405UD69-4]|uniref:aminoglycoside phosphotransferase family protein n=1 Tax=Paraglaciecola sp. 2405UD69-4 TaxID=3391836 RepID=UPI0039C8ECA3
MNTQSTREQQLLSWINLNTEFSCQSLVMVSADASFRRYFRFLSGDKWIIAVDAPPQYENIAAFLNVASSYSAAGINVPKVYAYDLDLGFYCQQDFGNTLFSGQLNQQNCQQLYKQALGVIPLLQKCTSTENGPLPEYDRALVDRELAMMKDWLVEQYLELDLSNTELGVLDNALKSISEKFLAQPKVGVHRDYHSRNLMILDDEIGVIDFQDAVVGPVTYDAVSLLRDCYQRWPSQWVEAWLKDLHQEYYAKYAWADFKYWFDVTGMQRHIKVAGIFARLYIRDGKSGYLADIPRTLEYLIEAANDYPEYKKFATVICDNILPAVLAKQQGCIDA